MIDFDELESFTDEEMAVITMVISGLAGPAKAVSESITAEQRTTLGAAIMTSRVTEVDASPISLVGTGLEAGLVLGYKLGRAATEYRLNVSENDE